MISRDSVTAGSASTGVTSKTLSHTCSGSNRILWVTVATDGISGRDSITGVTYNGVAMTQAIKKQNANADHYVYLYYLIAPDTGTHDIVASCSESANIGVSAISYTGAKQSSQPDATASLNDNDGGSTITQSLTLVASECWLVSACNDRNVGIATGSVNVVALSNDGRTTAMGDSNGAVDGTGSYSQTWASGAGESFSLVMVSFSPAEASSRLELNASSLIYDSSLQGYWRLNGNFNDKSANGYNLTASGSAPGDAIGIIGDTNGAKDFEFSSSQYAKIAHASSGNLNITTSQTWLGWIKLESFASANGRIMSKADGTNTANRKEFYVAATGKLEMDIRGLSTTFISSDYALSNGVWYFVAMVYSSTEGKIKLWVNDTKKEVASITGTPNSSTSAFRMGAAGFGASDTESDFFDGLIDDAAVFNRALTDAEILARFNGTDTLPVTTSYLKERYHNREDMGGYSLG